MATEVQQFILQELLTGSAIERIDHFSDLSCAGVVDSHWLTQLSEEPDELHQPVRVDDAGAEQVLVVIDPLDRAARQQLLQDELLDLRRHAHLGTPPMCLQRHDPVVPAPQDARSTFQRGW